MAKKKSKKKHKKAKQKAVAAAAAAPKKNQAKKAAPKKLAKPKKPESKQSLAEQNQLPVAAKPSLNRTVLLIIGLVIIVLIGILLFIFGQAEQARDSAANTGQEDLLKVQPAPGDSLQPTTPNGTNPQNAAPSPQGSEQDSSNLQQSAPSEQNTAPQQ
jgi:hypothetical protein